MVASRAPYDDDKNDSSRPATSAAVVVNGTYGHLHFGPPPTSSGTEAYPRRVVVKVSELRRQDDDNGSSSKRGVRVSAFLSVRPPRLLDRGIFVD
jgi:hypothetical protein